MMLDFWVWQWMSKYDTRGVWLDEGMEWKISARYPQGKLDEGMEWKISARYPQGRLDEGMEWKMSARYPQGQV